MKVEMFRGADLNVMEDEINSFIKNIEVIDIKISTAYVGEEYDSTTVVLIIYKEEKKIE